MTIINCEELTIKYLEDVFTLYVFIMLISGSEVLL